MNQPTNQPTITTRIGLFTLYINIKVNDVNINFYLSFVYTIIIQLFDALFFRIFQPKY